MRRLGLLVSVAASLALVGERAGARGPLLAESHQKPAAVAGTGLQPAAVVGMGLQIATSVAGAIHRSTDTMSDGSVEVISLLVLGVSLIGAGQALGRLRRRATTDRRVSSTWAERHGPAAMPSDHAGRSVAHRAVR